MLQVEAAEEITTHALRSVSPPPPENRAICDIMWENIVERGRPQMPIWRMRIARCTNESTYTRNT